MDATDDVILMQGGGSVAATRQTSRTMKRTANLQERLREKSQAVRERPDAVVAPLHGGAGGESELADKAGKSQMLEDASGNNVSLMRTMLRPMLHETSTQLMDEQKKMLERLWDALMGNQQMTTQMIGEQLEMVQQLQQEVQAVKTQAVEELRKIDELRRLHEQSTRQLRVSEEDRGKAQVGEVRQAIEEKVQAREGGQPNWRYAAVVKDIRNEDRIRVVCRDEAELQLIREAAERTMVKGVRVLRDQLYSVKVDGANRTAVLDSSGNILPDAAEALGKENVVTIAKMHWLSNKENGKMYGSMVIYVTKASDARRLLDERYFHLAGESASTNVFERRQGPDQCYNCWETGHKAFACSKTQRCGKCAETGHRHRDCQAVEPKCVPCGGPHESFSQNCRLNVHKKDAMQLSMMNDRDLISGDNTKQSQELDQVYTYKETQHAVADTQHALDTERRRGGTSADTVS
ncbi:reverse transcriptase [Fusarium mundagurra]|uniref:Reverse transcriptase n=1 Tax=Fusarium mundagurra TaxID=1567541 RepID=A0A8H5Y4Y7_9HYPO|nr:reverse transcriptase [Fusarium mundagurra]